jgi:tRNA (mo5U34)-methyltransferase
MLPPWGRGSRRGPTGPNLVSMDIGELTAFAAEFEPKLAELKQKLQPEPPAFWYPFRSMTNAAHFDSLLTGASRNLVELAGGLPVADIGAADGDMGFLLEAALDCEVDVIDYGNTNHNCLWGAWQIKKAIGSKVRIHDIDLNTGFRLPRTYGLAVFCGILYHLKNPYYALEELARSARHALISTRIARVRPTAPPAWPARPSPTW